MGVRFARFIMGLVTIASDNGPPGRKIQSTLATPLERKNTRVRFSRKVELKVLVGVWDVTEQRVTEERCAIRGRNRLGRRSTPIVLLGLACELLRRDLTAKMAQRIDTGCDKWWTGERYNAWVARSEWG